ncbi:unnamed protein product [Ilex paraguariensis]|uniref:CONSTANS-like protein n=1 Tax=Ilex paraguariensis TaxID=185542 RepID=A0ABC8T1V5_9AQUA
MGMRETGGATRKYFPSGWSVAAKPCDYCKSAAALLFCRTDSAFMCMGCDAEVHGSNTTVARSDHARVWLCEVCEEAPATVTCKADAAALCVTCDRDIHSANPLARRHERLPVVPFYETAESVVKSTAAALLAPGDDDVSKTTMTIVSDNRSCSDNSNHTDVTDTGRYITETKTGGLTIEEPWILSNPVTSKLQEDGPDLKAIEFLLSDSDHFLDLEYPASTNMGFEQIQAPYHGSGADSIVPVQSIKLPVPEKVIVPGQVIDLSPENHFEIDFTISKLNSYKNSYAAQSLSHSVSSSSLDVGVVPDGSSMSDISYPFGQQICSSYELNGSVNTSQASQLVGMDREARVMRYREKRKNRKFEKTIRYASRKAYAETRPRIKGRFAKRIEVDSEMDRKFSSEGSDFVVDGGYGVVPSF